EPLAGLRLRRNLDFRVAVERRNLDLAAERRGGEADRHFAMQIGAFALEHRMRLQNDDNVEIPRRTAVHAGLALTAQPNPIVLIDAGRNLDRQRLMLFHTTDAMAGHTRIGNDLARSVTRRTRLLDREKSLRDAHFAAAVTCRAGLRTGARLRPGAVTGFARLHRRYANLDFGPARRF